MSEQLEGTLVVPDFSEVSDRVGEGEYSCRIVSAEPGKWEGRDGKRDTPFLNWRLETFGESDSKNNGRAIWHRTAISGKGAFRFQEIYKAAMGEDFKGKELDYTMLYGREVRVTVGPQRDKPEYTEVKAVRPISH